MEDWERDFAAYVEGRRMALRGVAYLLCGDWHSADDLTQTALTRLYLAWRRIDRTSSVEAYARRVLVRAYLDERRRPWRRERSSADPPDTPSTDDHPAAVDARLSLESTLGRLPARQRAVLVLRYWCDLDVRATAAALGISEGTVKSASARGLAAVREALQAPQPEPNQVGGEQP